MKTPAILHGQKYESIALAKYESEHGRGTTVLEIKCPSVVRNQMINTKRVPFLKEEDGHIFLDNNHDYFYQIQGQLFCTGATICNFVIYTFKDFKCIHVKRDDIFINMVKKLQEFYEKYFKSAVLQRLFYKEYSKYSFE